MTGRECALIVAVFGNVGVPVPACRTTEIRRTRIVGSHR